IGRLALLVDRGRARLAFESVSGGAGVENGGSLTLDHDNLQGALEVGGQTTTTSTTTSATLVDSLVNAGAGDTPGPEIAAPVRAIAGQASASNTAVTIRGSTLAASGNGFDAALYAYRPVGDAGDVNVDVRNSALRVL